MSGWAAAAQAALGIGNAIYSTEQARHENSRAMAFEQQQAEQSQQWQWAAMEQQNAWNLEQWNREAEYNSAANQRARLEAAGFSPLALLNGGSGIGDAAHMESASPASAPNVARAHSSADAIMQGAALGNGALQSFLNWSALDKEQQRIDNMKPTQMAEARLKFEQAKTEKDLRQGRFDFLGVQIRLGEQNITESGQRVKESEQRIKVLAQQIVESEQRVKQSMQWCEESGVRMSLYSFQKYASERKLPYEIRQIGADILLKQSSAEVNKATRAGIIQENRERNELWQSGVWHQRENWKTQMLKQDRLNAEYSKQETLLRAMHLQGTLKTPQLQSFDRAIDSVEKLGNAFRSYSVWLHAQPRSMPRSYLNR